MSLFSRNPAADSPRLSADDFKTRRQPDDVVLDVRTPAEFAEGHLVGAQNVDVNQPDFTERIEALGLDPAQPVYLYCRSGTRSGRAAQILRDMGFAEAHNVGGFEELARAGVEAER